MDTKLSKWLRWLELIEKQIYNLVLYKDVFWSVQDLIRGNNKIQKPSIFYRYLGDTYVSHALIGIRRQIKIDKDSISFRKLLDELSKKPEILSRKYFKSLYKDSVLVELGQDDKDFDKYCGDTPEHISKDMVLQDIDELIINAEKCEDFTDKVIAHTDKRDPRHPLTFDDIDKCIDYMDKLICKYNLIFHATYSDSLMPTYQYDWQEIFDEPWRIIT